MKYPFPLFFKAFTNQERRGTHNTVRLQLKCALCPNLFVQGGYFLPKRNRKPAFIVRNSSPILNDIKEKLFVILFLRNNSSGKHNTY